MMKRMFFPLMLMASVLTLSASCNNKSKAAAAEVATDSVAPGTISEAPQPVGELVCHMTNGNYQEAVAVFYIEKTEGAIEASMDGEEWKTLYNLRLVSYRETHREEFRDEDGGGSQTDSGGTLVVNAYDPQTGAFAGQFRGEFGATVGYDAEGEQEWGSQSFISKFTKADGSVEDVEFYGD